MGLLRRRNMATILRKEVKPSLETQPWNVFLIGCKNYLIKGLFDGDSYSVMVTDLGAVWEEAIKESDLLKRSKVCLRSLYTLVA